MPLSTALRQEDLADAYQDCHEIVYQIVHKTAARFGLSFEDLVSEAHRLLVKAYDTYDRSKGAALSTWVYSQVNWGLLSFMRKELRHHHLVNTDDLPEQSVDPDLFLTTLRSDLTEDANVVVSLILDSSSDFQRLCKWNRASTKNHVLNTLRECLEDMGWQARDIKRAMREIGDVLNGVLDVEASRPRTVFERCNATRSEIWLLARVGLTPREVRELLKP